MIARFLTLGFILLGACFLLRAENAPEIQDDDHSPLHQALLAYKNGKYDDARTAIDAAEKAKPGDPQAEFKIELLKARILTEQKDYAAAEKLLRSFYAPADLAQAPQDANVVETELALGDVLLRKRSFDHAAKYYSLALQAKPDDPDITLKLIYAKIGAGNLVDAGQLASHLTPLDAKNPYDDHASYYFAKAALAQATSKTQEAEDDIQTARTNYGITVTNRYLKTYLEVFASTGKGPASDVTPPPLLKPAPTGAKP